MSFDGVNVNKLNNGLGGENPTNDAVMALAYVVPTASLPAGVSHYTAYQFLQPKDAETLGFNAALDASADILVYHEVSEYFRLAPNAILWLIPVPNALTPVAILNQPAFKTAIRAAVDVKSIGIMGTSETHLQLNPLVEGVQAWVSSFNLEHRRIDWVLLEGKGTASASAISAYLDNRAKVAPNVSVVIGQDPAVVALDAAYAKYASVGSVLGMIAVRKVNENIGSVNIINKPADKKGDLTYPLTGPTQWLSASLSDGTAVSSLSMVEQKQLTAKGYIFAGSYNGFPGVYFNSSPTCVEMASDFAYGERNRTWNKAARLIRTTLLPEVKGIVKKDPTTGYIKSTTISRWEGLVLRALERMEIADEISGKAVYINPKQIITETTPLVVKAKVVIDGIVFEFDVDLGLANKI